MPPALEQREHHRSAATASASTPTSSATTTAAPRRAGPRSTACAPSSTDWVSTRDHSWGVRYQVGHAARGRRADAAGARRRAHARALVARCVCERPDGSRYALHWYYQRHGIGDWSRIEMQGGVEHPDGRREPFVGARPRPRVPRRQPPLRGRHAHDDDGRRLDPAAHAHRGVRHRVPPRHRPLPRLRRHESRRSGAASSTSTASTSPTAPIPRPRAASTSTATA